MKVGIFCVLIIFITLSELQQVLAAEEDLLDGNSLVVNENEENNLHKSVLEQNSFGNKKNKKDDDDGDESNESNESDESNENDSSSTEKSKSKKKGKKNKKTN